MIDVWGADHQGHVSRMKAAVQAIGVEPDRLTIIIHQLVTLREGARWSSSPSAQARSSPWRT